MVFEVTLLILLLEVRVDTSLSFSAAQHTLPLHPHWVLESFIRPDHWEGAGNSKPAIEFAEFPNPGDLNALLPPPTL